MATKTRTYSASEIGILAETFKRDHQTIKRWIKNNSPMLTSDIAKAALKKK